MIYALVTTRPGHRRAMIGNAEKPPRTYRGISLASVARLTRFAKAIKVLSQATTLFYMVEVER